MRRKTTMKKMWMTARMGTTRWPPRRRMMRRRTPRPTTPQTPHRQTTHYKQRIPCLKMLNLKTLMSRGRPQFFPAVGETRLAGRRSIFRIWSNKTLRRSFLLLTTLTRRSSKGGERKRRRQRPQLLHRRRLMRSKNRQIVSVR